MSDPNSTLSTRIESKIDKAATGNLSIGSGGNLDFANLNEIMEVAKVVAISQSAIPKHLRDNVGACLAICIQASEWRLSPFAVANKSYVVNDRIAFEAQLVAAVILKRAPITGRISYTFSGEGGKRRCKTSATLKEDGSVVEYESPEFDRIPVKNSPLWKNDPDQQLGYFSVRAMCRRHFPDVLLGIYTPDELTDAIDGAVQVESIPAARLGAPKNITPLDEPAPLKSAAPKEKPPEADPAPENENQERPYVEGGDPDPEPDPNTGPTAADLKAAIVKQMGEMNIGKVRLNKALASLKIIAASQSWDAQDAETLLIISERWPDVQEWVKNPTED